MQRQLERTRTRARPWSRPVAALVVLVALGVIAVNYSRPVPVVTASQVASRTITYGTHAPLPWPNRGQGAIGVTDLGLLAASPSDRQLPIASVAKVMTALVVLDAKPLTRGETGPLIAVTDADVADYHRADQNGESTVKVVPGEQLSEYQALQGLLIPSGNNVATLLARWSAASVDEFVSRMNAKAQTLGLSRTTFADPSGISPKTVSVPADLVRLGNAAMGQEVIADIVSQQEVTLPQMDKPAPNVNGELGKHNIVGIKTGNIPEVGAVYLAAATHKLANGRQVLVLAAVQGEDTLDHAFADAEALLEALGNSLEQKLVIGAGQVVGQYRAAWGSSVDLVAAADLETIVWSGAPVGIRLISPSVSAPVDTDSQLGSAQVRSGERTYTVPLKTVGSLPPPSPLWRMFRLQ